ncbi:hypothetical protein KCU65_g26, partial [Aureobasidium melanogenum]
MRRTSAATSSGSLIISVLFLAALLIFLFVETSPKDASAILVTAKCEDSWSDQAEKETFEMRGFDISRAAKSASIDSTGVDSATSDDGAISGSRVSSTAGSGNIFTARCPSAR